MYNKKDKLSRFTHIVNLNRAITHAEGAACTPKTLTINFRIGGITLLRLSTN